MIKDVKTRTDITPHGDDQVLRRLPNKLTTDLESASRSALLQIVHERLFQEADHRGVVTIDQKALAGQYGVPHGRLHRLVQQLVDHGRIRQIGKAEHGQKIVVVMAPT